MSTLLRKPFTKQNLTTTLDGKAFLDLKKKKEKKAVMETVLLLLF